MEEKDNQSKLTYGEYLGLGKILTSQVPRSLEEELVHDEYLFIIMHQTKELWFKQILLELTEARNCIRQGVFDQAGEYLERCSRVFGVLTLSWEVLGALRPQEFWKFRKYFGKASGLQSAQFREIEYLLGIRANTASTLRLQKKDQAPHKALHAELKRPSLWDETLRALGRVDLGIPDKSGIPEELLKRNWRKPYPYPRVENVRSSGKTKIVKGNKGVETAWLAIYRNHEKHRPQYRLGERLLDIASALAVWRAKHIATVERFIGDQKGSGGKGVPYLADTLQKRTFPELWSVRNSFSELSLSPD